MKREHGEKHQGEICDCFSKSSLANGSDGLWAFPQPAPLGANHEAEIHILTEPHDVVRSPSIVEQVAMNAGGKIGLEL